MLQRTTFAIVCILALFLGHRSQAQESDCVGAIVICTDDMLQFAPLDNGNSDFGNPNNDPGCLEDDENGTVWYYFEFNQNMPPGSELEFTLDPFGGFLEDYDFAIYGPNLSCDSLGSPVRCSFANSFCDLCPLTGLGMGATDTSEGWEDEDGFIAPLVVNPGEGFYLVIDYFAGNGFGFQLSWGGSAAPFLNCLADPDCIQYAVDAGNDINLCDDIDTITLNPNFSNLAQIEGITWSDTTGAPTYLTNDTIAQPQLILPDTFSGELVYQLSVNYGGCMKYDYLTIRVKASPVPQIVGDTTICIGTSTTLNADDFASYHWSNDSTTQNLTVFDEGRYFVTVTDNYGCTGVDSTDISFFPVNSPVIQGLTGICADDSLSLRVNNDYPTYIWSTSDQSQEIVVYAPGTYYVSVTDENNCLLVDSIEIQALNMPTPVISGQDSICMGETAVLSGGSGYSSYLWSTGDTLASISSSQAGDYQLTVTNAVGCSADTSFNLSVFDNPIADITGNLTFCEGSSTELSNGTAANLTYLWSGGEESNQIEVSQPGMYSLVVTNEFGCRDEDMVEVQQLDLPELDLPDQISFCEGLDVTVYAGNGEASYEWSDGSVLDSLIIATPGIYDVQATALNGCTTLEQFEVVENPAPAPQIDGDAGFCSGGMAQLTAGNWLEYQWSTGDDTDSITIDIPGLVSVTVTDDLGCIGTGNFQVEEWPIPEPVITGNDIFCPGEETTLSGPVNFVNYLWSTGDITEQINTDDTGIIILTVTDDNGCNGSTNIELNVYAVDPPALPGDTLFCAGDTVQMDAGIGYQTYLWSDNSDSRFFSSSTPGDYSVTAIDMNGCPSTTFFSLSETALPVPEITPDFSICSGDTAQIEVVGTYLSYQWSAGENSAVVVGVNSGTYSVTVEDANHCFGTASMDLGHFDLPQPSIIGNTAFCAGDQINLQAETDYPFYAWSSGEEVAEITVDTPGLYELSVTDINGCVGTTELQVNEMALPEIAIEGAPYFCTGSSTFLEVPSGFFTYTWSNGAETNTIEATEAGTFSVTVMDDNGCVGTDNLNITNVELPPVDAGGSFLIDCYNNGVQIGIEISGPYTYQWTGPDIVPGNAFEARPFVAEGGQYSLIMKDTVYGCESPISFALVDDVRYEPEIILSISETLDCNQLTATIDGENSTSGDNIIYRWYNPEGDMIQESANPNLLVDTGGLFTLELLDVALGCETSESIEVIADFAYPEIVAGTEMEINCFESTLSLSGEVVWAQAGYAINWEALEGNIISGASTLTPTINEAGSYILSIANPGNGCISRDTVFVTDHTNPPIAIAQASDDLDCVMREVGLSSTGSSTGPTINYEWQNSAGEILSGSQPEVTMPGNYLLIVLDQSTGCSDTAQVNVLDISNPPLDLALEIHQPKCFDEATGSLEILEVSGGTGPFLYRLNGDVAYRPTEIFDHLSAGEYEVQVQDAEGCELSTTFQINEANEVVLDIGQDLYIKLGTPVELEALTNISPIETDQLIWTSSTGESCNVCPTWELQPLETTQVVAEITDINGCKAQDELTIFVKKSRDVYIPNAISPNLDGVNDAFTAYSGKDVMQINTMKVFDRWGGLVFEAFDFFPNNPADGWDGKYKGDFANGNVFAYFIEVEFIDGEKVQFSGDVTIIY